MPMSNGMGSACRFAGRGFNLPAHLGGPRDLTCSRVSRLRAAFTCAPRAVPALYSLNAPRALSFRAEQANFFFLLRSDEEVGRRSRGISLRLSPCV